MKFNSAGLGLIKEFEGCALRSYQDQGGVWTVGWGSTRSVCPGMVIDQVEADRRLFQDITNACTRVRAQVDVPLTDNQYSALVSFTFNEGSRHLHDSTLLKLLNDSKFTEAADQFLRWMKIRGQDSAGLLRRRQAERALFLTPVDVS